MSKEAPPPYQANPPPPGFYPPGQYPPPPHHGPAPPPTVTEQHTVIVTTATTPTVLGSDPTRLMCPYCHANIVTTVETEANTKTHLFALLLCLFICWPCVCLPYCMDSCQSKKHFCPNCKAYLGTFAD